MPKKYIIAETAYNHEGDFAYLRGMVDDIAEMGLDAVKFHLMLNPESYAQHKHPLIHSIRQWTFDKEQWSGIIGYAAGKGLDVVALCDDVESLTFISERFSEKVRAVEIHATGINDWFLLRRAAGFAGCVILGIGGSTIDEISYAVDLLRDDGCDDIILMYGFQSYPTNYSDINLSRMLKIRDLFGLPVGYADHTAFDDPNNEIISVMAAAMGVEILEKHYTPDHGVERIDYHAAVGREQMLRIKELMDVALAVHGTGSLAMSSAEREYGNTGPMKKAIVAKRDIAAGERLSPENLWFKRTVEESMITQKQFTQLVGLEAIDDIDADEIIDFGKVRYEFKAATAESFTHINQMKGQKK